MAGKTKGKGTKDQPWVLKTPSGGSEYEAYRDESLDPPALVVKVGKTELRYQLRAVDDLHQMLKKHGDWMTLGSADEQKEAKEGTVEAWGRSSKNPVGGWYGLKKPYKENPSSIAAKSSFVNSKPSAAALSSTCSGFEALGIANVPSSRVKNFRAT
jgi:hypothetical protein